MNKTLRPPQTRAPIRPPSPPRPRTLEWVPQTGPVSGAVKDLAARLNLSRDTLTRITGFSPRAVANWVQGSKPSLSTSRRLTEVERLFTALERLLSPEAIGPWLREPNPAFDGSTPLQVIERGETDRIWRMVCEMESGEPA